MSRRYLISFFILAIIISITIFWIVTNSPYLKKKELTQKEEWIISNRVARFSISGGEDYPNFIKELVVDPEEPKKGEKQFFSVWAVDPVGIERVTATIKTDTREELIELKLVEGKKEEGKWQSFWIVKDVTPNSRYDTVFRAINKEGKETEMPFVWYSQDE